jgi:large subunit ribosomal protein L10
VDRAEKQELVSTLHEVFKNTSVVVVAHYSGLSVSEMTALRKPHARAGASLKVAKNRLAKLALEGTEIAHMADLMKGPTVIAYSDDPVIAPKVAVEFARTNQKLVVLGGAMGSTALDAEGVKSLATLPSLDELRAKLVGMIKHSGDAHRAGPAGAGRAARPRPQCLRAEKAKRPEAVSFSGSNRKEVKHG